MLLEYLHFLYLLTALSLLKSISLSYIEIWVYLSNSLMDQFFPASHSLPAIESRRLGRVVLVALGLDVFRRKNIRSSKRRPSWESISRGTRTPRAAGGILFACLCPFRGLGGPGSFLKKCRHA